MSAALRAKAGSVLTHQLRRRRREIPWRRRIFQTWSSGTSPRAWATRVPVQVAWRGGYLVRSRENEAVVPPREKRSGERLCIQLRSGRLFRWGQVDNLENSRYLEINLVADRPVY
jgi:hypothetical protein